MSVKKLLLLQISNISDDNRGSEGVDNSVRLVVDNEAIVNSSSETNHGVKSKWFRHSFYLYLFGFIFYW